MNSRLSSDDSLDIGQIFRILMMQSKVIIAITFLGFALAVYNHLSTDKTYKVTSLLQITSEQSSPLNDMSLGLFAQGANTSDIGNIEMLYKSRTNLKRVVDRMKLNIQTENSAVDRSLLFNKIKFTGNSPPNDKFILQVGYEGFNLNVNGSITKGFAFQQDHDVEGISINIAKIDDLVGSEVVFKFIDEERAMNRLLSSIQVQNNVTSRSIYQRNNGLVEVSIIGQNIEEAKKILDYYNNSFIDQSVEIESEKARRKLSVS